METARCRCPQRQQGPVLEFPDGHKEFLCGHCRGLIRREPELEDKEIELTERNMVRLRDWQSVSLFPIWGSLPVIVLLLIGLAGCVRPVIPPAQAEAAIQVICPACLPGQQVGVAPLTVYFSAQVPGTSKEILWDFGDGASATGTLVSHTYEQPGLYQVMLSGTTVFNRKVREFKESTFVKVLARQQNNVNESIIPNRLASITVIATQMLGLGEHGLVCVYITPRRNVTVISLTGAESDQLIAESDLEQMWLYVPAGSIVEYCFFVRAFRVGQGSIQFIIFIADDREGERSEGRIPIVLHNE